MFGTGSGHTQQCRLQEVAATAQLLASMALSTGTRRMGTAFFCPNRIYLRPFIILSASRLTIGSVVPAGDACGGSPILLDIM